MEDPLLSNTLACSCIVSTSPLSQTIRSLIALTAESEVVVTFTSRMFKVPSLATEPTVSYRDAGRWWDMPQ